jgi:hypothetical protein
MNNIHHYTHHWLVILNILAKKSKIMKHTHFSLFKPKIDNKDIQKFSHRAAVWLFKYSKVLRLLQNSFA